MTSATPFPRLSAAPQGDGAIWQRARAFCGPSRLGMPVLVPSELVTSLIVDLPAGSARQRAALLPYAIEDRIAQPIETVVVAPAHLQGAAPGQVLALVMAQDRLTDLLAAAAKPNAANRSAAMPDLLLIRRPAAPATGSAWAVWRDGARAVVRVSDGTGFAINVDMLAAVWALAGRPVLTSLGAALPTSLPAIDLSAAPPDPDPADLSFRFPVAVSQADRSATLRPLIAAGVIALAGCVMLQGLAIADTIALGRIADTQQATAQAALFVALPGIPVTPDVTPILQRLTPTAAAPVQGAFLPLLAAVTASLATAGPNVTLRRLNWAEADNNLTLTILAAGLDDLQTIEAHLVQAGFAVTSGAATAGEGGAEVELSVTGPAP
jgi:general secretion pathway protein L